jgi:hypothetical protein
MVRTPQNKKAALIDQHQAAGFIDKNPVSRFPTPVQTGSGSKGLIPLNHLSSDELPQGLTSRLPYGNLPLMSMRMTI